MTEYQNLQPQFVSAECAKAKPPVEIRDGFVYKPGEPQALEAEAVIMRLAARVGERSGRFAVPELRQVELGANVLVMEHIPQLLNLHQVAAGHCEEPDKVFHAAGRALATVHRELHLPTDKLRPLPDCLKSRREDEVVLHGDFCCNNVFYQPSSGRIVLLDWATAPLLGTIANFGCRYFDLVWFAWSLFFWTPPKRLLQWRPERLVRALGSGYAELEGRFRWERYVQYRRRMHWMPKVYWRGKCSVAPANPLTNGVQLLGWLRWRLFPRGRQLALPTQAMPQAVSEAL